MSDNYRYFAQIDKRTRQYFDISPDGSLDFGQGEQCAGLCGRFQGK